MKKNILTIELVPKTCWFSNIRSAVSSKDWDFLRKDSYLKANYRCEICNGVGSKHPVECHEVWDYDDKNKTQKLIRLISLCPNCHKVKHPGLAAHNNQMDLVISHFSKVNNCSKENTIQYIEKSFKIWRKRSQYNWFIDLTFLDDLNISYKKER